MNTRLIAHRGGPVAAPENTLAAFRRSYQIGRADSLELDVGMTSDGVLAVLHDDTMERTTNGRGRLDQTPWSEVAQLDAGSWFAPQFKGEPVPRLDQVMDWAKGRIPLTLELKASLQSRAGVAEALLQLIEERGMESQVSVISFSRPLVEEVERLRPELQTGLLFSERPTLKRVATGVAAGVGAGLVMAAVAGAPLLAGLGLCLFSAVSGGWLGKKVAARRLQSEALKSGVDTVLPFWIDVDRGLVESARAAGKSVVPYTANHPRLVRHLFNLGVAGVITDVPEQQSQVPIEEAGRTPGTNLVHSRNPC